jgi:formate-dependent nitrite reductase membrane component NrfD
MARIVNFILCSIFLAVGEGKPENLNNPVFSNSRKNRASMGFSFFITTYFMLINFIILIVIYKYRPKEIGKYFTVLTISNIATSILLYVVLLKYSTGMLTSSLIRNYNKEISKFTSKLVITIMFIAIPLLVWLMIEIMQ